MLRAAFPKLANNVLKEISAVGIYLIQTRYSFIGLQNLAALLIVGSHFTVIFAQRLYVDIFRLFNNPCHLTIANVTILGMQFFCSGSRIQKVVEGKKNAQEFQQLYVWKTTYIYTKFLFLYCSSVFVTQLLQISFWH